MEDKDPYTQFVGETVLLNNSETESLMGISIHYGEDFKAAYPDTKPILFFKHPADTWHGWEFMRDCGYEVRNTEFIPFESPSEEKRAQAKEDFRNFIKK